MADYLLLFTIFAPLLAAVLLALIPGGQRRLIEWGSLVFSLVVFALSLYLFASFDSRTQGFQFNEKFSWIAQPTLGLAVSFSVGLDGISLLLFTLTTFLMPVVILSSWTQIHRLVKEYYILLFVLETAMLGTFAATNLLIFFIFWEMILIPMFFIIGIWGSEERVYATFKFILFTALGSFLMLAALVYLYLQAGSLQFTDLYAFAQQGKLTPQVQLWLFLAFALAFAIKVPMFPFHTWLPDAHVQAPTAGSVILAGVLLKMGTYGLVRLAMPLFPDAFRMCLPYLIWLAVVAIVYGALVSYVQTDMKKLVAYSSISHLGYVMLGLFVLTQSGVEGSILQMVNHGISTGGLFLLVGVIYQRYHTREITAYGGMARIMPKYATVFLIVALSSIGLPLTNGFVGEFLVLVGAFHRAVEQYHVTRCIFTFAPVTLAASGMILSALYMLWLVERVFFGECKNKANEHSVEPHTVPTDLTRAEMIYFTPILLLIFWIGIYPGFLLNKIGPGVAEFIGMFKWLK
jgi:NADH-quinone oxidoreductase subunit M